LETAFDVIVAPQCQLLMDGEYIKAWRRNWRDEQIVVSIPDSAAYHRLGACQGTMIRTGFKNFPVIVLAFVCVPHDGAAQTASASATEVSTSAIMPSPSQPEFNLIGFGDIGYVSRDAGSPDGFTVGQAVAHFTASLDNSLRVFGEFSMTAKDDEYKTGIERMIVRYDFSDRFKLSAGRYHSPIGYWNSAFHHGAWLQTTTSRPEMAKFGSKIIPIHFVGVLLEGSLPQNKLGLSYSAGFGNGRHENIAQAGDAGDINSERAWLFQVNASPHRFFGLKTGIGYYSDRVSPGDRPDIDEKTLSAYVAWENESPEIIFEYLHSEHEFVADSSVNGDVDAWYAQFAYRLSGRKNVWKPYARYEKTEVDDTDPLLGDQGLDYEAAILGVRWDFSPYAALKGEYRNEEFDSGGREDNFRLQVSFVLAKL
jgi:hypothetical protein